MNTPARIEAFRKPGIQKEDELSVDFCVYHVISWKSYDSGVNYFFKTQNEFKKIRSESVRTLNFFTSKDNAKIINYNIRGLGFLIEN